MNSGESTTDADAFALFELAKQIEMIRDRTRLVAFRSITSAFIYGSAGIGKTYWCRRTLDDLKQHYELVTGNLSAQGLFELLKRRPDSILLLDDVSRVFRNSKARDIFLAALGNESGSDGARQISYHIGRRQQTVSFTGSIIATANALPYGDETVAALYSRTQPMRWTPSTQQVEAMMKWSVKDGWKDVPASEALVVAERVIEVCRRMTKAPEMRLLHEHALPYYAAHKRGLIHNSWEDHLLSSISGIVKVTHTQTVLTRDQSSEHDRRLAAELLAKHKSTHEAVEEWYEKSGGKSLRTLQRHAAQLRIAE